MLLIWRKLCVHVGGGGMVMRALGVYYKSLYILKISLFSPMSSGHVAPWLS